MTAAGIPWWAQRAQPNPSPPPVPRRGFSYECQPCDIKGWAPAEEAEELRCWACGEAPAKWYPSGGVDGIIHTNPDVPDGTSDRALWI